MSQELSSLTAWVVGRRSSPGPLTFQMWCCWWFRYQVNSPVDMVNYPIISCLVFQPIWKICSSNWIISPSSMGKNKFIFENQHLDIDFLFIPLFTMFFSSQVVVVWDFGSHPTSTSTSLNSPRDVTPLTCPDPWVASGAKVGTWRCHQLGGPAIFGAVYWIHIGLMWKNLAFVFLLW